MPTPASVRLKPWLSTIRNTAAGCAPMAIRMPISRLRSVT